MCGDSSKSFGLKPDQPKQKKENDSPHYYWLTVTPPFDLTQKS